MIFHEAYENDIMNTTFVFNGKSRNATSGQATTAQTKLKKKKKKKKCWLIQHGKRMSLH